MPPEYANKIVKIITLLCQAPPQYHYSIYVCAAEFEFYYSTIYKLDGVPTKRVIVNKDISLDNEKIIIYEYINLPTISSNIFWESTLNHLLGKKISIDLALKYLELKNFW